MECFHQVLESAKMSKINWELVDAASNKLGSRFSELKFDFHGHYKVKKEYLKSQIMGLSSWHFFSEDDLNAIVAGEKLVIAQNINMGSMECYYCGEHFRYVFDGETFTAQTFCSQPGGIKKMFMELNVPSGKMVFANDLRRWFRIHGHYNVNNNIGVLLTTKAYEKVGMAHGFVSNTCPGVYQIDARTLSISGSASECYWDNEVKKYFPVSEEQIQKQTPLGKEVGGICTDLWWYSIVDFEDFKCRFLDMGGTLQEFNDYIEDRCDVVDVDSGVYTITHYLISDNDQNIDEPCHYAKIIWNRLPEVNDLYSLYKKQNYTIGQCWLTALANYPSLYRFKDSELPTTLSMEERVKILKSFSVDRIQSSVNAFYDYTFCNSGRDWHDNGWSTSTEIDKDTPDFILPSLADAAQHWYPMERNYCVLFLAATQNSKSEEKIHFNDTFLMAAYDVCYSILKHGVINKSLEDEFKNMKNQKEIALASLQGLNKQYPHTIPERCKEFLNV